MRRTGAFFLALLLLLLTAPLLAQEKSGAATTSSSAAAATAGRWIGPDGKPLPFTTHEQILEFLNTANVVEVKPIGTGITRPHKVTLEKDGVRIHAVFHDVNVEKNVAQMASGRAEAFFRDFYAFQPAAYELSRMLGMDNVPPTVERRVRGTKGSLQFWVENAMTEEKRQKEKIAPPDVVQWSRQIQVMRVFDNLIYNIDRTQQNILIDPNWKMWLIDHTRAFRRHEELMADYTRIAQCERGLWEKLRTLDGAAVKQRLKPYISTFEIDGVLARQKKLVEHIQKLIDERGEQNVLFALE